MTIYTYYIYYKLKWPSILTISTIRSQWLSRLPIYRTSRVLIIRSHWLSILTISIMSDVLVLLTTYIDRSQWASKLIISITISQWASKLIISIIISQWSSKLTISIISGVLWGKEKTYEVCQVWISTKILEMLPGIV